MSIIKEFREFFLRDVKTTTGSKPDQEVGFPVTYVVDGVQRNNRFLKNHVPSEAIYKKLFESIPFKLNVEDTASESGQGLSKITTDLKAFNRQSESDGAMRAVIQPHQLPELGNQIVTAYTITGDVVNGFNTIGNINDIDIVKFTIGSAVTGAGIPVNTMIDDIDLSTNIITLNNSFTITGTGVVITQVATDSTINTKIHSGISLTSFRRTLNSKFKKAYSIIVSTSNSIIIDKETQKVQLDGDAASPGNNKYYGTNNAGVKGWQNGSYINEVYTTITGNNVVASAATTILTTYTALATNTLAINYMAKCAAFAAGDDLQFSLYLKKNGVTVGQLIFSALGHPAHQATATVSDFDIVDVVNTDVITLEITNTSSDSLIGDVKMYYKKIA